MASTTSFIHVYNFGLTLESIMPPINSRTIVAPIAAFSMACLLFVYTRTSIQAAKRNAKLHREADGGQISWQNENLRRHGILSKPGDAKGTVGQLAEEAKEQMRGEEMVKERVKKKRES